MNQTSNQISVVVQGPICGSDDQPLQERVTYKTLKSVREILPDAELILSTWNGSNVAGLDYDVLLQSEPPPAWKRADGWINNVNRQIVSTLAGLNRATRPLAMKLRSDCELHGSGFLDLFDRYSSKERPTKVFKQRLVTCSLFSRRPQDLLLFHVSDLFHFGRLDDMKCLWDIPMAPENETSDWHTASGHRPWFSLWPGIFVRYTPEQYIWVSCLQKMGVHAQLNWAWQITPAKVRMSELALVRNFVVAEPEKLGVRLPQRLADGALAGGFYTFADWLRMDEVDEQRGTPRIRDEGVRAAYMSLLRMMKRRVQNRMTEVLRGTGKKTGSGLPK